MYPILPPGYCPIMEKAGYNMQFTKMQGCGNDYIYIYQDDSICLPADKSEMIRRLSDRHFGVGGDGVILIHPSREADFEMEMYNADGSRGKMCGNGIRCVAKYVYDHGYTTKTDLKIISCGSIKTLILNLKDGLVDSVRVDMGEPQFQADLIPVIPSKIHEGAKKQEQLIHVPWQVDSLIWPMTAVSMGNPHAVLFTEGVEELPLDHIGPLFEHHPAFPEGVNTEFVQVLDQRTLKMRVWERGSGETLACGTGACASVAAAVQNHLTERKVTVQLAGGELEIEWSEKDGHLYMTGPARTVFEGNIEIQGI